MKSFTALCLFGLLSVALCETYTDKFDGLDVQEVIENERLFNAYFACVMDNGPCTSDASEIKHNLAEAMATNCEKCTVSQKRASKIVIKHLVINKKEMWDQLCAKFDPQSLHRATLEKEAMQ